MKTLNAVIPLDETGNTLFFPLAGITEPSWAQFDGVSKNANQPSDDRRDLASIMQGWGRGAGVGIEQMNVFNTSLRTNYDNDARSSIVYCYEHWLNNNVTINVRLDFQGFRLFGGEWGVDLLVVSGPRSDGAGSVARYPHPFQISFFELAQYGPSRLFAQSMGAILNTAITFNTPGITPSLIFCASVGTTSATTTRVNARMHTGISTESGEFSISVSQINGGVAGVSSTYSLAGSYGLVTSSGNFDGYRVEMSNRIADSFDITVRQGTVGTHAGNEFLLGVACEMTVNTEAEIFSGVLPVATGAFQFPAATFTPDSAMILMSRGESELTAERDSISSQSIISRTNGVSRSVATLDAHVAEASGGTGVPARGNLGICSLINLPLSVATSPLDGNTGDFANDQADPVPTGYWLDPQDAFDIVRTDGTITWVGDRLNVNFDVAAEPLLYGILYVQTLATPSQLILKDIRPFDRTLQVNNWDFIVTDNANGEILANDTLASAAGDIGPDGQEYDLTIVNGIYDAGLDCKVDLVNPDVPAEDQNYTLDSITSVTL